MTGIWGGINRLHSEAFVRHFDADASEIAEASDTPPRVFTKNTIAMRISHEMALDMGLVEPTPEERARRDEEMRLYQIKRNEQALIREAAWASLRLIEDPAIRAVLDLHAKVDTNWEPECAHCYRDTEMGDREDWPCETTRVIATAHGIEMPR